jgi:hypothetical protein
MAIFESLDLRSNLINVIGFRRTQQYPKNIYKQCYFKPLLVPLQQSTQNESNVGVAHLWQRKYWAVPGFTFGGLKTTYELVAPHHSTGTLPNKRSIASSADSFLATNDNTLNKNLLLRFRLYISWLSVHRLTLRRIGSRLSVVWLLCIWRCLLSIDRLLAIIRLTV